MSHGNLLLLYKWEVVQIPGLSQPLLATTIKL
jgi:hypothetical protein